ncbi:putative nitrogen fixation protein [Paenibacillus anaericanus]|uniref:DUF269 domain-containing protein n=1 Tax=Paenibacillus anaericanus TaxID=170367 RepID=UPI00278A3A47|nr:DUF269 domain-containing protein [Paenibacillus anaericanus]MDQ0086686.1 putative nitrogen fixation protein [Paenibacillus anaericanus]
MIQHDEHLGELFSLSLNRCLHLCDPWGKYDDLPVEERIAKLFLCSPEQKRELASACIVSPVVKKQVSFFFQTVATVLEQLSGEIIQSMVEINEEGFGRAIVYSGRTVLVSDSFRGGSSFPFAEYLKVQVYGVSCIREGLQNRERYRELFLFANKA